MTRTYDLVSLSDKLEIIGATKGATMRDYGQMNTRYVIKINLELRNKLNRINPLDCIVKHKLIDGI